MVQLSKWKFLVVEKQNPPEVNRYILEALTSFSVHYGKDINYKKASTCPLSLFPFNTANANGSRREIKKSKRKNIIIESSNLKTDENLHELSRGIAMVDNMPVFNTLVSIPSSCAIK